MYAIFRSFLLLYPPLDTSFKRGTEGAVLVKATSLHWKKQIYHSLCSVNVIV